MPWIPELFTAPELERVLERDELTVPYFDGLLTGEIDALIGSFAGEPQLHDPLRGRVKGADAFAAYVEQTRAWLAERNVTFEDVERAAEKERGFGEVVLHLDGERGRLELPYAIVADRRSDLRIEELRLYYSGRPLTGRDVHRPPLLQADPGLGTWDAVAGYERALAAGDPEAVVAAFEPDGYARDATGAVHRGAEGLRAFYARRLSGDGVRLEHCASLHDGRLCALEHNVLRSPPQAGLTVYVEGPTGKLAAARIYDDA
jgi:hypothetical protein